MGKFATELHKKSLEKKDVYMLCCSLLIHPDLTGVSFVKPYSHILYVYIHYIIYIKIIYIYHTDGPYLIDGRYFTHKELKIINIGYIIQVKIAKTHGQYTVTWSIYSDLVHIQ